MILYPAIDLKDGQCVRLERGDMAKATVFGDDPAAQAKAFIGAGCQWLHVVDLNGAIEGRAVNAGAVEAILRAAGSIPVQLGGGIRDLAAVERWLTAGVSRVVLGTVALRDPALVREACRRYQGRIAVGIDARAGLAAVAGWVETSSVGAIELALRFEDAGVATIIYTDIDRDGVLEGPNLPAMLAMARAVSLPVIASGGVSSIDDIAALKSCEDDGIAGIICGRALYDGRVDLRQALALVEGSEADA